MNKQQKKIAFIVSFPPPLAGQSLAAKILYDGIVAYYPSEFEPVIFDLSEDIGGESTLGRLIKILKISGNLALFCIKNKNAAVYLQLGHGKASILRDLVFIATSKILEKKILAHVHGSGYRQALEALPKVLKKLAEYWAKRCDAAIVLSDSLRAMFSDILPDERIFVVKNGVEPNLEKAAAEFTRQFSPDTLPTKVLYLSNLLEAKGFGELLQVAKQCQKDSIHFDFVGPKIDGQKPDIEEFIKSQSLNNVRWHGSLQGEDKIEAYKEADIFVLPSHYEGQPLCILEAMHFALPVIATNVGGIPDIFNHSEGAILLPKEDIQGLKAAILELGKDKERRQKMGKANQEKAQREFSTKSHVDAMVTIFRKIF